MRLEQSYLKVFDNHGYDPEDPTYPKREDLSSKQKDWVKRAWIWASTEILRMDKPSIPDAIPRYNERRGIYYVPAINPNLHHINPVGESLRLEGRADYNKPKNIVPLSARLHIGTGVMRGEDDEDFVIHKDTLDARRKYGPWKQRGGKGLNPMMDMHLDRKHLTDNGYAYHDDAFDEHFRDLAAKVVSGYMATHDKDPWPERIDRKRSGGI